MTEEDSEETASRLFDQFSEGKLTGEGRASSSLSQPHKLSREEREHATEKIEALYRELHGKELK